MEAEVIPDQVSAAADAQQAQFTPLDYGREGDTRPYQIVAPTYPAPQFLRTYANLNAALRECRTLCDLSGKPFRLVRWGSSIPCLPCRQRRGENRFGTVRAKFSTGALEGYPEAEPVLEMLPRSQGGGLYLYGPKGEKMLVGRANYLVARKPFPVCGSCRYFPTTAPEAPVAAPPQHYLQAVKTAQFVADREGRQTYVCAGFGASCKDRDPKKWLPVVYVSPGGLVARYPYDLDSKGSVPGSTNIVTSVGPASFKELIAQSEGASFLPMGA